jgi:hypothetical protein
MVAWCRKTLFCKSNHSCARKHARRTRRTLLMLPSCPRERGGINTAAAVCVRTGVGEGGKGLIKTRVRVCMGFFFFWTSERKRERYHTTLGTQVGRLWVRRRAAQSKHAREPPRMLIVSSIKRASKPLLNIKLISCMKKKLITDKLI